MVLSHVGISIAPLLASAGVVGIAVGFGAQTLVKDLFSGTCFLIEDVFRIGEYIEAASAKGTVEKITFRTVALRHQNGPLHFVPYGSLGTVRNNSRDWVIDKFEIPLPVDTDSEQIRRMMKKIGQDMQEDPALAPLIMSPLKAKLYRIDPGVKVYRCKVQTQPGLQFELRTDAYRRIEAALKEAGIPFATSNQERRPAGSTGPDDAGAPGIGTGGGVRRALNREDGILSGQSGVRPFTILPFDVTRPCPITSFNDLKHQGQANGLFRQRASSFASFKGSCVRAINRLEVLEAATCLDDLRCLPSNRLEALKGSRAGQYSIRINNQWRLCFDSPRGDIGPSNV